MERIWLITGCSTGFGRELAIHAAQQGDTVVGTLRKKEQVDEFDKLVEGKTHGVLVDVRNATDISSAMEVIRDSFGQVDVLVNNAGYGSMGPIEEVTDEEVLNQFEVNVFGAVRMIRAVLPLMRQQRSGHILNITSIAGLNGFPGIGIYNGSKFALEGIGEALAAETAHLGIKVTNIEPGPFRTDWAGRSATYTESKIEDYNESAAKNMESIQNVSGKQVGSPKKAAMAMYEVVQLENPPLHLPLGGPAYHRAKAKFQEFLDEIDQFESIGLPTDYTEEELKELDQS